MKGTLDIKNFTRRKAPGLPFADVAHAVLPGWDISLVFAGETRAQALNVALRGKDYIPNVLSYEAGPESGEIIICPLVADRQAPSYDLSPKNYCLFLFIHALLHLKGQRHGATMERYERAYLARFIHPSTSHGTTHRNRH
ncbi:MAG: rRNA maturation RNase YbeY [Patescibacteria group bacterium]